MSKITAEMWEKAIAHLNKMYDKFSFGDDTVHEKYYACVGCESLQDRYDDGERSIELYNAMMELC